MSSSVAGHTVSGTVLDVDATIVICSSDKELAAKTWSYGFHPLLCECFLDATREALSGLLRTGSARVEHHRRSHRGPRPGPGPDP